MAKINFVSVALLSSYTALATKDANTLYFIEDAKKIYKGSVDVTESLAVVSAFDTEEAGAVTLTTAFESKLYINATTYEMRIKSGSEWVILSPGYITTYNEFNNVTYNGMLATAGAIKEYITKTINDITGGTAFVKGVSWEGDASTGAPTGNLLIDKGEAEPTKVPLTGVAHNPAWDNNNFKLTIPVFGGDDVVVNIPKDMVVTSGAYHASYEHAGLTYSQVIVLTIANQEDPVIIPADALVDSYTADNSAGGNVTVTVDNETNKISAVLSVSAKDNTGKLVTVNSEGNLISSTDYTVRATGDMGDSATEIPVASVIAAAITTAVQALQASIDGKLDKLGAGVANEIIISTADGDVIRSGKTIGGATLADTPDANTLATEAAVADALSWKTITNS